MGSHAGLAGWEGKHKMSLSSQAPDGRRASPLEGFPRKDLQILAGRGAGSARGKAPQAVGEAAGGEIRTGCVLGGRLCRHKGTEAEGSDARPDLSAAAALRALVAPSLNCVPRVSSVAGQPESPWRALSFPPLFPWIIPRKLCSVLKKQHPEQRSCLLAPVRGTFSLLT